LYHTTSNNLVLGHYDLKGHGYKILYDEVVRFNFIVNYYNTLRGANQLFSTNSIFTYTKQWNHSTNSKKHKNMLLKPLKQRNRVKWVVHNGQTRVGREYFF